MSVSKKKNYTALIDFRKAFDSVNRSSLSKILEKYGFSGRVCQVLKFMFEDVKCCVRTEDATSESFQCFRGVKQGCNCGPIFFSILINVLAKEIKDNCKHCIQLTPNSPDISILLFADDIVLLSDTVIGLQNQINNLKTVASRLGLQVNLQKTKVVIFRNGGHIAAHEHWYLDGKKLV